MPGAKDGSAELIGEVMPLLPQRKAEGLIAGVNDGYLRTAMAQSREDLTAQTLAIQRSLEELAALSQRLSEPLRLQMEGYILTIRELFSGPEGLIESRRQQIEMIDRAERVLDDGSGGQVSIKELNFDWV